LEQLGNLPTEKGVYVLIDSRDLILYIGQTSKGLAFRWNNHERLEQAKAHDPASKLHYQVFPAATTSGHLLAVESAMISIFNPLWNGTSRPAGESRSHEGLPSGASTATAGDIISAYFRPGYAASLSPEQAIELALEIGLKLVKEATFPNLPEKTETSQTR
jgi:excinuclease UvrABC nuclease subunit